MIKKYGKKIFGLRQEKMEDWTKSKASCEQQKAECRGRYGVSEVSWSESQTGWDADVTRACNCQTN